VDRVREQQWRGVPFPVLFQVEVPNLATPLGSDGGRSHIILQDEDGHVLHGSVAGVAILNQVWQGLNPMVTVGRLICE
jgi:hypothetical protein